MAVQATVLSVDGTATSTLFEEQPQLVWLKTQVGGYIELVAQLPHVVFVCEGGLARGLPVNELARERFGDVVGSVDGYLRGPVVVIEPVH